MTQPMRKSNQKPSHCGTAYPPQLVMAAMKTMVVGMIVTMTALLMQSLYNLNDL